MRDERQGTLEALYGTQGDVPFEVAGASETSAAAAAALGPDRLARLEQLVQDVVQRRPQTCDAVEAVTGLPHQTVSARIRGLVLRGRLVDSGTRARTRSGRLAVVWRAA